MRVEIIIDPRAERDKSEADAVFDSTDVGAIDNADALGELLVKAPRMIPGELGSSRRPLASYCPWRHRR